MTSVAPSSMPRSMQALDLVELRERDDRPDAGPLGVRGPDRRPPRRRAGRSRSPRPCARRGPACASRASHDWPEFTYIAATSRVITASRSASSSTMLADLPPSSCATRLTVGAALRATSMPARVDPVNDTISDVGMRGERGADRRAVALDEVEDAGRHARLGEDLGDDDRVQRRDLRRLEDHRAAGRQRRRDLGADLVQRPVPRRDERAHPDRLGDDGRRPHLLLELEALQRLERDGEVPEPGGDLGVRREAGGSAHLQADGGASSPARAM